MEMMDKKKYNLHNILHHKICAKLFDYNDNE